MSTIHPADYVELQTTTAFSFHEGASHADELVLQAAALGQKAIGVTDRNTLAGVVRAYAAAKQADMRCLVGARLDLKQHPNRPEIFEADDVILNDPTQSLNPAIAAQWEEAPDGSSLLVYPIDRDAYGQLSQLLTLGRRRAPKGECYLSIEDVHQSAQRFLMIALPPVIITQEWLIETADLIKRFGGQVYIGASHHLLGPDRNRIVTLKGIAETLGVPLIATNDVRYHVAQRRRLHDVMACVRLGCRIDEGGLRLFPNAERHLKSAQAMANLFAVAPDAVWETKRFAERITFSLDELAYQYPREVMGTGLSPQEELERLTWQGARKRFGYLIPADLEATISRELELINELDYAAYFLTVYDLVRFANEKKILCQGRGSAANSSVCYVLGITAVDPTRVDLLFERFISAARDEPPDIDVDFEHQRREEVIQYVYQKYGRHRAGLAATVVCYRTKGAIRDVGKVMGLSEDVILALSQNISIWNAEGFSPDRVREIGLDPDEPYLKMTLELAQELVGFPRHLSQHVGGFVLTDAPLTEIVPVENAAMDGRTIVQWDKDDLDTLKILKVDVLALGMLTAIAKSFELIRYHHGKQLALYSIPHEDRQVYGMISKADTVGVFQIESRAQMSMLPRLRPKTFYDLVIEVAIVRPGPIQGDMVHPYLRRRQGLEEVSYPSKELERVLGKTLGVPLFQEQAMKIAIVAAGFTPEEADELRRAMATFRKSGLIHHFHEKLVKGMVANGYEQDFAERVFKQIEGFGNYGFPESHAASFALLVYVSCWLKHYYPHVFTCALLNSQPMGFYAPAQLVRDARDHGVEVRGVDINHSQWDNSLEMRHDNHGWAIRLGLRQVKGLREEIGRKIVDTRANGYGDVRSLWERNRMPTLALEALARADAFTSLSLSRRQVFWDIKALPQTKEAVDSLPLFEKVDAQDICPEEPVTLPEASVGEEVADDYRSLRMSLRAHPCELLRARFKQQKIGQCDVTKSARDGERVTIAGLVLVRQRPGSAKGVIFVTLEDESGVANLVVWSNVFEQYRRQVLGGSLLKVRGRIQREGEGDYAVVHLVAEQIEDLTPWLGDLQNDMANQVARADEVRRDVPDITQEPGRKIVQLVPDHDQSRAATTASSQRRIKRDLRLASRDFH